MKKITLRDFKKRINKSMPNIFNYEYKNGDDKFSIFDMGTGLNYTHEELLLDGSYYTKDKQSLILIEEGLELINNYYKNDITKITK